MRPRSRGLSLTELMVATLLLSIVIAAGLTALARARGSRLEAAALQQLHERAQYVFATLEPELQMAGYFGTAAAPLALDAVDIPPAAQRCGSELVRRLDLPLQVATAWPLPCAPRGGGAVPDSGVLTVRRASVREADGPAQGRAQWWVDAADPGGGRLFWQGEAPWGARAPATTGELRELLLRVYYVAREADGDKHMPALRVKSLGSIAGQPAFIDTEVMPGVEDLQVELLPSSVAPRTARVRLRVRAGEPVPRDGEAPRWLDIERHFALRNAPG